MIGDPPLAVILGCAGPELTHKERKLFNDVNPLGLILFERNCTDPDQVLALTNHYREVVGREDAPVFVDQEGGRVTRLKPPHWRHPPSAYRFVELAKVKGEQVAVMAIQLNSRLIAEDLKAIGITVNCAPVLDVSVNRADLIIGDRSLGSDIDLIEKLSTSLCSGLHSGNVLPVIKHVPGHGRALVDSHQTLPVIEATFEQLAATDFEPFRRLNNQPVAMTAHVIYTAIDEHNPATVSPKIIEYVIRGYLNFDGLLISDDLSMQALSGDLKGRAEAALSAGCDAVLHCNGKIEEMVSVVAGAKTMSDVACRRWLMAMDSLPAVASLDRKETLAKFDRFMSF